MNNKKAQMLEHLLKWESLLKQIFPVSIPNTCVWEDKEAMIKILNAIASISHSTHVFLPGGGGIDIIKATESAEEGCIELFGGIPYILKPDTLTFHSFNNNYEWSYFRLETKYLSPSGIYEDDELLREELTEINPGFYVERSVWEYGYYGYDNSKNQEKPLPKTARIVIRYMEGAFVIFTKTSHYNLSKKRDAYDGYHNMMSSDEFKNYILKLSHLRINRE